MIVSVEGAANTPKGFLAAYHPMGEIVHGKTAGMRAA